MILSNMCSSLEGRCTGLGNPGREGLPEASSEGNTYGRDPAGQGVWNLAGAACISHCHDTVTEMPDVDNFRVYVSHNFKGFPLDWEDTMRELGLWRPQWREGKAEGARQDCG